MELDKSKIIEYLGILTISFFIMTVLVSLKLYDNSKKRYGEELYTSGFIHGVECRSIMSTPSCMILLEKTQ